MAVLEIRNFGGLRPSASARALQGDAAQVAHNILPRATEFRPLADDRVVVQATGVSNPKTIHRFAREAGGALNDDMTKNWRVSGAYFNIVRGPVNNDTTERSYVTVNDGSTPPYVIDNTGETRQMGVPQPAAPLTVTVDEVDEFTADDRPAAVGQLGAQAEAAIMNALRPAWIGDRDPGGSTPGYLKRAGIFTTDPELGALQARLYRIGSSGGANTGALTDAYNGRDIGDFSWIADPALGSTFYSTPASGAPAWMGGTGQDHRVILFPAFGLGYTFDRPAAEAALSSIMTPGDAPVALLDAGQINAICDTVEGLLDGPNAAGPVEALRAKAVQLRALLDGDTRASTAATAASFYDRPNIVAEVETALDNFANTVFNVASSLVMTQPLANPGGDGG